MIPNTLPTPPPTSGAFHLELFDRDRLVGYIRPDRIGFVGFANEVEAAHAALVAERALARRRARRDGGRPVPIDIEPLTLRRESDGAFVYASHRRVARIVRPGDDGYAGDTHAFELALPAPLDEVSVRAKALVAYRTLRRAGVRWAMWRPVKAPAKVEARAAEPRAAAPATGAAPEARSLYEEMIVEAPIPARYLIATIASFLMLVVAVVAPGAIATVFAAIALATLTVMRLTVMHARWPRRLRSPAWLPR